MTYIGIINDDYLEHHGVKGMKWGVRKHYNKNYYVYRNRKGKTKRMRITKLEAEDLRDAGLVNRHGNLTSGMPSKNVARRLRIRRGVKSLSGAAAIGTALVVGHQFAERKRHADATKAVAELYRNIYGKRR